MGKPKISVLTDAEVDLVHQSSLDILEHVGAYLPSKEALDILANAGAHIDYEKSIARIPPNLVEECLRKAPSEFKLFARDPRFNLTLGSGNTYFAVGAGSTLLIDMETDECREANTHDLADMVRMVDGLDNLFVNNEIVLPRDVPPEASAQHMWNVLFNNTSKHFELYLGDADGVKDAIRMASAVVGSEEQLAKKPIMHFVACIGQPLTYEKAFLEGLVEAARRRIPLFLDSGAAAGGTGPATLAGTLALANAEILSGITLVQIISPGIPIIIGNWARTFDLRSETICFCGPEYALMRIAAGQLAQRYNLPLSQGGFQADSKILDLQASYEKYIALISLLAGTHLIVGSGMLDAASVVDPINFIIDDEIAASYSRINRGIDVNLETLAFDIIKSVGSGPGHNFLSTEHTFRNYRKENWLDYTITERRPRSLWRRDGSKDMRQRALEKARNILKTHQPEHLPSDTQAELDQIVREAEKRSAKKSSK